jgi:hypothetical protein
MHGKTKFLRLLSGKTISVCLIVLVALMALNCNQNIKVEEASKEVAEKTKVKAIQISSPAFADGAAIPKKYTCEGEDVSPPLKWGPTPEGTKSFALISEDPDAPSGTWVHWVIYDIPGEVNELSENIAKSEVVLNGVKQGLNDFEKIGYGGPCPPAGKTHRYFFKIYALDSYVNLKSGARKEQLIKAIQSHILAEGQLIGTYRIDR